ncbi:hypothetical protein ACX80J_14575 [Arthrobacter sp. MDB2-24]
MSEGTIGLAFLLFTLIFLPAACVFVTRQAAEGSINRNAAAGIRTRYTQASDEAWTAGRAAALPVAVSVHFLVGGQAGPVTALVALIAQTVILFQAAAAANGATRTVKD